MYTSTLPRSNWLRPASIRFAWYRHMPASSLPWFSIVPRYDAYAAQLLKQYVFDTAMQRNVTQLREMMGDQGFAVMCNNLTHAQITELIVKWGHYTAEYIFAIDALRGSFIIPFILQVCSVTIFRALLCARADISTQGVADVLVWLVTRLYRGETAGRMELLLGAGVRWATVFWRLNHLVAEPGTHPIYLAWAMIHL